MNKIRLARRFAFGVVAVAFGPTPLSADPMVQPHDVIAVYSDITTEQRVVSADIEDYFLMCRPVVGARVYEAGTPKENLWTFNRDLDFGLLQVKPNIVLISFADPASSTVVVEKLMKHGSRSVVAIPPSPDNHLTLACTCLKALGCDGAIGSIDLDLAAAAATSDPGQKILSVQNGIVTIESSRYPFCFVGDATVPATFNDDLNRYMLVAKGISTQRAKVTWGDQSCEFSARDLTSGVNLAAAFAGHTPFDTQFAQVSSAVWTRQKDDAFFNDTYFNWAVMLKHMAGPQGSAAADKLGAAILDHDRTASEAAAALVVPIKHTLKVEAIPDAAK